VCPPDEVLLEHDLRGGLEITPRRRASILTQRDPNIHRGKLNVTPYREVAESIGLGKSGASTVSNIEKAVVRRAKERLGTTERPPLHELLRPENLDASTHRVGRPPVLTVEDLDRLVATVKKNWDTRHMTLDKLRREADSEHASEASCLLGVHSRGITAHQEAYKFFLTDENKKT